MQTVFYDILVKLTQLLTPIMPHTAEEIWSYLEHEEAEFVQLTDMPKAEVFDDEEVILAQWQDFMTFRTHAQKALEEARSAKIIGKSLEAHLTVYVTDEVKVKLEALSSDLAQLLIVSELTVTQAPADALTVDGVSFVVTHAEGHVCERCRRIDQTATERSYQVTVCDNCANIVESFFPEAVASGFEK